MIFISAIIHPYEIFNIKQLAERLNISEGTVRNLMKNGLKYKKMNSIILFTGQNILNYLNEENELYTKELVEKVFDVTGVKIDNVKSIRRKTS